MAERIQSDLRLQLETSRREIRELESLRGQIAARMEVEEKLVSENEELSSRLNTAEHKLALWKASLVPSGKRKGEGHGETVESDGGGKEEVDDGHGGGSEEEEEEEVTTGVQRVVAEVNSLKLQ